MRFKGTWYKKWNRSRPFFSIYVVIACWVISGIFLSSPPSHKFQLQAAELNDEPNGAMTAALQDSLPPGVILGWSGPVNDVPKGWALCNGKNGTPDLQDRFIVGFSKNDIGATGGRTDHSHDPVLHKHLVYNPDHHHVTYGWTDETEEGGEHAHPFGPSTGNGPTLDEGCGIFNLGVGCAYIDRQGHSHNITEEGIHSHSIEIPDRTSSLGEGNAYTTMSGPTVSPTVHLPPYYKIAFIIKLPEFDPSAETSVAAVPDELIVAWSGPTSSLPDGWVVCDGQNNTPDLRNRFILGAENEEAIGTEKVSTSHNHLPGAHQHNVTMQSHSHGVSNTSSLQPVGNHTHSVRAGLKVSADAKDTSYQSADPDHVHKLGSAGAHTHDLLLPDVWTSPSNGTGLTEPENTKMEEASHIPPYYKVAFIKKFDHLITGTIKLAQFPADTIAMWSGSVADLPPQWAICDGSNGTPDLRGRFLAGTVVDTGLTGGKKTHLHILSPHTHTVGFPHSHRDNFRVVETSDFDSEHRHHTGDATLDYFEADARSLDEVWASERWHDHYFWPTGIHTHSLELGDDIAYQDSSLQSETSEVSEGPESGNSMPSHYKLAFVIRTEQTGAMPMPWVPLLLLDEE